MTDHNGSELTSTPASLPPHASLKERLKAQITRLMKARDAQTLAFARNLLAPIRKKEIDQKKDLLDHEVQEIVASLVKQRHDSIEQFQKAARADLVAAEQAELQFLFSYLPAQMSETELEQAVEQAVLAEALQQGKPVSELSLKDQGALMKRLQAVTQGRADGKSVNARVRAKLAAVAAPAGGARGL